MSRSRRHSPVVSDQQKSSTAWFAKRLASKAVRREDDIPDGRWYTRLFNPYDICDYKSSLWWGNWSWADGSRYGRDDWRWWSK